MEGGFYNDDADVHRLGSYEFATCPSAAYYSYAALITGHETYCPTPRDCGLYYDRWDSDTGVTFPVSVQDAELCGYDIDYDDQSATLRVKRLPPPCSSIHVLGRMPRDGYFSTLSNKFNVKFSRLADGWAMENVSQAWGMGLALRWLGYDAEMSYRGQRRIANWASNDSSMATRPFDTSGPDRVTVELVAVHPRQNVFAVLPSMAADINNWTVEFAIDDTYSFNSTSGLRVPTTGTFLPPGRGPAQILLPDEKNTMYVPIVIRAAARADVQTAGFQILTQETPHYPAQPINPSMPDVLENQSILDNG